MAKGRMTSAERAQKMLQAKELYVRGFALNTIGEITDVGQKTLTQWRTEKEWDREKELANIRPSEIKKLILQYVQAIKEGRKPEHKADDLSKISAAFDRMNDSRKIAVYTMESIDGFCDWLLGLAAKNTGKKRETYLKILQDLRPFFDQYISHLLDHD